MAHWHPAVQCLGHGCAVTVTVYVPLALALQVTSTLNVLPDTIELPCPQRILSGKITTAIRCRLDKAVAFNALPVIAMDASASGSNPYVLLRLQRIPVLDPAHELITGSRRQRLARGGPGGATAAAGSTSALEAPQAQLQWDGKSLAPGFALLCKSPFDRDRVVPESARIAEQYGLFLEAVHCDLTLQWVPVPVVDSDGGKLEVLRFVPVPSS